MIAIKAILVLFLIAWVIFGGWMVMKFSSLFGPHSDDRPETAGARSLNVAHIVAVWIGFAALAIYFLAR